MLRRVPTPRRPLAASSPAKCKDRRKLTGPSESAGSYKTASLNRVSILWWSDTRPPPPGWNPSGFRQTRPGLPSNSRRARKGASGRLAPYVFSQAHAGQGKGRARIDFLGSTSCRKTCHFPEGSGSGTSRLFLQNQASERLWRAVSSAWCSGRLRSHGSPRTAESLTWVAVSSGIAAVQWRRITGAGLSPADTTDLCTTHVGQARQRLSSHAPSCCPVHSKVIT